MKKFRIFMFILLVALFALGSCAQKESSTEGKPLVITSIEPQAFLAERILGDSFEIASLIGPGQSPHSWEPGPREMARLSEASYWLILGIDFENALVPKIKALYPDMKIIDTRENVIFRQLSEEEMAADDHEHDDHDDPDRDPHIWLGRQAVEAQLATIMERMAESHPELSGELEKNHRGLMLEIESLYSRLEEMLAPLWGSEILVYHPAFGYFMDDFGLKQVAIETGGKEPTPRTLNAIMEMAQKMGIRTVFVQAQFPASAAKTIADALGGNVLIMDPLAKDWLLNLEKMASAIKEGAL